MKINTAIYAFVTLGIFVLSGCGIQGHVQKTPGTELASYKTFKWLPSTDSTGKAVTRKNFQESYLKGSISDQLKRKGLTEITAGDADISIDYDVQVQREEYTRSEAVYSRPFIGYRYSRFNGRVQQVYYPSRYVGNDYYQVPYKSGTITVNIVDNKTNEVTWQGWAETAVDRKKLSTDEIDRIVKAIFKKYRN